MPARLVLHEVPATMSFIRENGLSHFPPSPWGSPSGDFVQHGIFQSPRETQVSSLSLDPTSILEEPTTKIEVMIPAL